jgi:aconitate hydratase
VPAETAAAVKEGDLVAAAVLSGNRNFEGRVNPLTRANYLASPPLVVAYALAGTVDIDFRSDPLGNDSDGNPVYLKDLWPTQAEITRYLNQALQADTFREQYAHVFEGDEHWQAIEVPEGNLYSWSEDSTYVREPSFFQDLTPEPLPIEEIREARVLALLGDSVTTDHISPAGVIPVDGPAGRYLREHGVEPRDFNSFGSRRGNHEVMMRGTFANIRLKNLLVPGTEGGVTRYLPDNTQMSIYDAAMKYREDGTPLVVLAGKDYGMGSSRDWAAKGTYLLGVRAVIAESYERIHRSNLVGMGVLPLQFQPGDSAASLGLTGEETFSILGLNDDLQPRQTVTVEAVSEDGSKKVFQVLVRVDTPVEVDYYRNGGILQTVLRRILREG